MAVLLALLSGLCPTVTAAGTCDVQMIQAYIGGLGSSEDDCADEDGSLVNKAGHNCTDIKGRGCGQDVLDDDDMDFSAQVMCCACGGGVRDQVSRHVDEVTLRSTDAMQAYVSTVGACRGGASPSSNAGLKFYSHRDCEALCEADSGCTGYVLPASSSNWCETYTSIGATGDGRSAFVCYMKGAADPTPASGAGGGDASSTGDPHLVNVRGQHFDILQPGTWTLLKVPRKGTLLRVDGDAARLGGPCADMYFQELNVTGKWAEAKQAGGLQYRAADVGADEKSQWMQLGKVDLKVVHGHTLEGIRYLNVYARHLNRTGYSVGGLLGDDDHSQAATPAKDCEHRRLSLVMRAS